MLRRTVAALAILLAASTALADALHFTVTYAPEVADSYTGRVYVMLSSNGRLEPRFGSSWFRPDPFFAVDVVDWKPNEPLQLGANALGFPAPIAELVEHDWHIQAVMRRSLDSPTIGQGGGTAVSEVATARLHGASPGLGLRIERVIEPRQAEDTDRVKFVRLRSDLLSDFHGRDIFMQAALLLPVGYEEDLRRRYPALYIIPGFGGSHERAIGMARRFGGGDSPDLVKIGLDPRCRTGHHVFADSANNGPWGTALVEELIPHPISSSASVCMPRHPDATSPAARPAAGRACGCR